MHDLAARRFGDAYDPEAGIVRFAEPRGRLKPEWARLDATGSAARHAAFFLERNPGYVRGHELVCLTEIALENMPAFAARIFRRALAS